MRKRFFIGLISLFLISSNVVRAESNLNDAIEVSNLELINEEIDANIDTTTEEYIDVLVEYKVDVPKISYARGKVSSEKEGVKLVASYHDKLDKFVKDLKKVRNSNNDKIQITHNYTNVFAGSSLTIKGTDVKELANEEFVKKVWLDNEVQLELPEVSEVDSAIDASLQTIGVDRVLEQNITGKGIKVGVLDTGIDYNHPDLTTAYRGYRADPSIDPSKLDINTIRGWDFVNNDADPMETTYDDWKNSGYVEFNGTASYYTSHGTHVAGTIAAVPKNTTSESTALGVAPDVDLYAYRVLGPYGSGYTSNIIAAMEKTLADGMDIINMSLGGSYNNNELDPYNVAVTNLMLADVLVVIAAGNSGGYSTVGSPGASDLSLTVGSATYGNKLEVLNASSANFSTDNLRVYSYTESKSYKDFLGKEKAYEVFDLGKAEEFEGIDLTGKVAVIKRGEIAFLYKAENAMAAGAEAVIIYNNVAGNINHYFGKTNPALAPIPEIPIFFLDDISGKELLEKGNKTLSFGTKVSYDEIIGRELSSFSSRGPVNHKYAIKPDLVAPGSSVLSTVPSYEMNKEDTSDYSMAYGFKSGTSMATPHVAGVAALMMQESPELTALEVKAKLMNSSTALEGNNSVFDQGVGMIDAYKAVNSKVLIKATNKAHHIENSEPTQIEHLTGSISYEEIYNDVDQAQRMTEKISLTNNSDVTKNFTITSEFNNHPYSEDAKANKVKLVLANNLEVKANKTKTINAKIVVPKNAAAGTYEGYINFINTEDKNEVYRLAFSIRNIEKGIKLFEAPPKRIATLLLRPIVGQAFLEFNSPMVDFQWYLYDLEGNVKGLLMDAPDKTGKKGKYDILDDVYQPSVLMQMPFVGVMKPYIPELSKFADIDVTPNEGEYRLVIHAQDVDGKNYEYESHKILVTNDAPELVIRDDNGKVLEPGVHEITEDMLVEKPSYGGGKAKAYWLEAEVDDKHIEWMQENNALSSVMGTGYDHSYSFLQLFWKRYGKMASQPLTFSANKDKKVVFGVTDEDINKKSDKQSGYYEIAGRTFQGLYDLQELQNHAFVEAGSTYVTNNFASEEFNVNNRYDMTITGHNLVDFISGEINITTDDKETRDNYVIQSVDYSEEFKAYMSANGIKAKKFKKKQENGNYLVGLEILNKDFAGLSGKMDLLDIKFSVRNSVKNDYRIRPKNIATVNADSFVYKQAGGQAQDGKVFFLDSMIYNPTTSILSGYVSSEVLSSSDVNKFKEGTKLYAIDNEGNKYTKMNIDSSGKANLVGVKANHKFAYVYADAPQHLATKQLGIFNYRHKDNNIGIFKTIITSDLALRVGDLNNDELIDINDIHIVASNYLKDDYVKKADLNKDGVVDEKDVRLIEANYLEIGALAPADAIPRKERNGKTIDDYLKQLGLKKESAH